MCSFLVILSLSQFFFFFFLNDPAPTEIYTLPLHDALPISQVGRAGHVVEAVGGSWADIRNLDECERGISSPERQRLFDGRAELHRGQPAGQSAVEQVAEIGRAHV